METAEGEVYRLRRVGKAASRPDVQDVFRLASTPKTLQIGRNPAQCDVFIDSQSHPALISRRHAEIHVSQDRQGNVTYDITDRSVNGTYVNDIRLKPQTPHRLQEGDTVTFGHLKAGTVQPGQLAVQAGSEFKFRFEKCVRPGDVDTRTDSETPTLSQPDKLTAPGDAGRGNGRQLFPSVPSPDVLQDISNWVQKSKLVNTDAEKGEQKTSAASSSSTGQSQLSVPDDSDSEIFSIAATLQIPSDSDSDSDIFSHADLKTPTSQDKSLAKDRRSDAESPGAVSMATTVTMATDIAQLSQSPVVKAGGKTPSSTVGNTKRKRRPNAGKPAVPAKRGRRVKSDRSGEEEDWVTCDSFDCSRPEGDMISWVQCDQCECWYHVVCAGCDYDTVRQETAAFNCGCL